MGLLPPVRLSRTSQLKLERSQQCRWLLPPTKQAHYGFSYVMRQVLRLSERSMSQSSTNPPQHQTRSPFLCLVEVKHSRYDRDVFKQQQSSMGSKNRPKRLWAVLKVVSHSSLTHNSSQWRRLISQVQFRTRTQLQGLRWRLKSLTTLKNNHIVDKRISAVSGDNRCHYQHQKLK